MFYYKENQTWKFSEDQYLTDEAYHELLDEYYKLPGKYITTDVRDLNRDFYGLKDKSLSPEEEEAKRKRTMIGIILGCVVFASLVVSLILKQILIFGFIFCAVFLIAGLSLVITGKGGNVESASRALINRITGVFISLASAAILLLLIFRSHFEGAELLILIACILFGLSGIALPLIFIMKALSGKFIYTEEINAVCKGYVRSVSRDEGSNHMMHTFILSSPLFSYNYNGIQYEALYDEFVTKKDSDIALGQSVPIRIDPKHPEGIMSPVATHPLSVVLPVVMGLMFLAAAIFMGTYVLNGSAKSMTVETQWNSTVNKINGESESTEPAKLQLTDEMIEKAYANDLKNAEGWYVEYVTVADHEDGGNLMIESFTDESFAMIACKKGKEHEPGKKLLCFYTVDKEKLAENGSHYKNCFSFGDPDTVEYTGSHGAYQG